MAYLKQLKDVMQSGNILDGTLLCGGRDRDQLVACSLAGSSLGLSSSEALNLHVDKFGQVNASASFVQVLPKRAGWKVGAGVSGEPHRETATVTLIKDGERYCWSVSMDDVARSDLSWQERWKRQPKASLVAYATVQAIRIFAPEVLGQLGFAPEEGVESRPKSFASSFLQEPKRPGVGGRPQAPVVAGEVIANTNGSQGSVGTGQPVAVAQGQGSIAPVGGEAVPRAQGATKPSGFNPNRSHPVQRFGNGSAAEEVPQPAPVGGWGGPCAGERDDRPAFRPIGKAFLDRVRASAPRRV
jgi:hypothetical protein